MDNGNGFQEHRRHERFVFQQHVTLRLEGGHTLAGITRDVSIRGCFLAMMHPPSHLRQGEHGTIHIEILGEFQEFPCTIAHVSANGIGLDIDRRSGRFGFALTAAVFAAMGLKSGAETRQGGPVRLRVTVAGHPPAEERLHRVSLRKVEFFNRQPPARLPSQTPATLHLAALGLPELEIAGEILSHDPLPAIVPVTGAKSLASVHFPRLAPEKAQSYRRLVETLQRRHLNGVLAERSQVHAQLAPPPASKERQETVHDLSRFFGYRKPS